MANPLVVRAIGPTMGLSVGAASHAAVTLTYFGNETCNYVYVANTSTTLAVAFKVAPSAGAAVLPADGTSGDFLLAPAADVIIAVSNGQSNNPIQVTAIASGAGPTLLTVTPIGIQT